MASRIVSWRESDCEGMGWLLESSQVHYVQAAFTACAQRRIDCCSNMYGYDTRNSKEQAPQGLLFFLLYFIAYISYI